MWAAPLRPPPLRGKGWPLGGHAATSGSPPVRGSVRGRSASRRVGCRGCPAVPPGRRGPTPATTLCVFAQSPPAGCHFQTSRGGWRDTEVCGASHQARLVLVHSLARCHIAAPKPYVSPWIMIL